MNTDLMFSKASDEWTTPQSLFDALDAEFDFAMDAAATAENSKTPFYLGPDRQGPHFRDALDVPWSLVMAASFSGSYAIFLNPPYSRCSAFVAKAAEEARSGCTVVALVPARTDTRWFHADVWDRRVHRVRPGVELRFLPGRLKFGDAKNSAPFPSVVIVFRPLRASLVGGR